VSFDAGEQAVEVASVKVQSKGWAICR